MSNIQSIPFTELFERLQQQVKDTSTGPDVEARYKGYINDVYVYNLPQEFKWPYSLTTSTVTLNADYNTGTVHVTVGASAVTGSSTVFTTGMTNRTITFSGHDEIYTFTYVNATTATINPTYSGTTDISGSYTIVDYDYSVGSSFVDSEQTKMYYWSNGQKVYLERYFESDWKTKQSLSPGTPDHYYVSGEEDSSGYEVFYITPPDDTGRVLHVEHEKRLDPMTEYTGDCTIANGKTALTGSSTLFTANVAAGDYFRIDANGAYANSKWYKVSSVNSNTSITLATAWQESSVTINTAFTICKAPSIPYFMHEALLWGAAILAAEAQGDDKAVARFRQLYAYVMTLAKRRYERRKKNKRMRTIYETKPNSKR